MLVYEYERVSSTRSNSPFKKGQVVMVTTGKPTSRGKNTCHFDLSCCGKMFSNSWAPAPNWSNEKRTPGWLDYTRVKVDGTVTMYWFIYALY